MAGALFFGIGAVSAQPPSVEARIAGLESNREYMSLLEEDARLQNREDSTVRAVESMRQLLRENPAERQRYSDEILALESRIFEIRNAKGRLIDRINTIEQEWVLANLNGEAALAEESQAQRPSIPDSLKVRNLIRNPYFRENLPEADYRALLRAQGLEMQAVDYVNRYLSNYGTISDLAEAYAAAETEAEAVEIHDRYEALQGFNRILADSLSGVWNYIFDNKSYAYGYLLDLMRQDEALAREEERLSEAARELTGLRGRTASDELSDYFLRKRVLIGYETSVAGLLDLKAARDSLRGVEAQLKTIDFRLPRIEVEERYFLDFDTIAFSSTPKYSYQHPIPECKVYARGTIYRILLGTFNTKRAAATFRGAYPLCYLTDEEGKWRYFAGGFATLEEAEAAQALLKKRGFVRPEIVVWTDGVYRNLSQEPRTAEAAYRVEITGTETLSERIRQAIADAAEGTEISRVGQQLFVVGAFSERAAADRVADAIRQTDPQLEIKVEEIKE
ncbi:SPOR domain-containing protein [Alistipes sp.]|uniref:SPOR domain-containing protein n=1 Tax=Alistipes sp. TaxID=1872444 RepID=UPI003AEF270F